MHYITWGLLINLGAVFSFIKSDGIRELAAVFNTVGRIADGIGGGDAISIQLFLFVCFYYVAIFIMLVTVHGMIKIFGTLEKISARIMDGKKEEINKVSEEKVKSILTTEIHA